MRVLLNNRKIRQQSRYAIPLRDKRRPFGIDTDKTSLEAKVDNGKVLTTKPYYRDSLKYADMIMQLNGSENVDLSEYDQKKEQNNKDNKKSTRSRKSKQNSIFA